MVESASVEIQLATASINEEDQNTQKEADITGGNENKNDELVIEIREIVERPEIQSSTRCRIHRVPHSLRKWNEEAYTPQVVSIGPFHHKNERLKAMEEHKDRYFRSFVKRSATKLEYLVGTIREMEESIRGCYEETIDLTSDRFVKMILVDACFIVELFFQCSLKMNPLIVEPRATAVMLDLLLLENQVPFFVIEKLHQLSFPSLSNDDALLDLSFKYFGYLNIWFRQQVHLDVKIEHFTDLLRTFQMPPPGKVKVRRVNREVLPFYSATQLYEAGVKFKVWASERYLDVEFGRGVLKIPRLEFNDWTEVIIRNIIALEQTRYIENAYFTDYFLFMDSLIKTRKDVDLLCKKGILVNYLGDNDAAKSMTNNLNKGIVWNTMSDGFFYLRRELNGFYETPSNRWKALLISTYFSSSSDFIYVVHNIFIMTLLTIIQAIYSIIQVAGPSSKPK